MSAMRTLVASAVVLFLLAAVVPNASAQTGLANTRLEIVPEHFPKAFESDGTTEGPGLPQGESTSGFVNLNFCYGQGAFNPDQATKFKFTLSLTAPEWVQVTAPGDAEVEWAPPTGPHSQQEEKCEKVYGWEVKPAIAADAPNGTMGDITYDVAVDGPESIGTYKKPAAPASAIAKIKSADPGDDPLAELNQGATNTGGGGGGGDTEAKEGSAPVAPLTALLGLAALAFARRRL